MAGSPPHDDPDLLASEEKRKEDANGQRIPI
jgi:hypothetical protein